MGNTRFTRIPAASQQASIKKVVLIYKTKSYLHPKHYAIYFLTIATVLTTVMACMGRIFDSHFGQIRLNSVNT